MTTQPSSATPSPSKLPNGAPSAAHDHTNMASFFRHSSRGTSVEKWPEIYAAWPEWFRKAVDAHWTDLCGGENGIDRTGLSFYGQMVRWWKRLQLPESAEARKHLQDKYGAQ